MWIFIILTILGIFFSANKKSKRQNVCGKTFQLLETISILEKTTKYEIWKSRYSFALKLGKELSNISQHDKESAKKIYFEKYSQQELSFRQHAILEQPDALSNPYLMAEMETEFFIHFCDEIREEIASLKTDAAKQRRIYKTLELAKQVMEGDLNDKKFQKYHKVIIEQLQSIGINGSVNYNS